MTEQDEKKVRQMIVDVIGKPLEEIIGRLNVLNANVTRIEGNTERTEKHAERTNGRVTKLEDDVSDLKKVNIAHFVQCPNTEKIINLEKMEVSRKAIAAFSWKQVTFGGILAGLIISIIQLLIK